MTTTRHGIVARACYLIATGFGIGRMPFAPGTFGTLLAIPIYLWLRPLPLAAYVAVVAVLFIIGIGVCSCVERHGVRHDAPIIVWDEIVGYLVTMTFAPSGWLWVAAGFMLFRLFDIWKPFPIRRIDRTLPGGFGTMLDDALAGIYASVVLQLLVALLSENAGERALLAGRF